MAQGSDLAKEHQAGALRWLPAVVGLYDRRVSMAGAYRHILVPTRCMKISTARCRLLSLMFFRRSRQREERATKGYFPVGRRKDADFV